MVEFKGILHALHIALHQPLVHATLTGMATAAGVDLHAFMAWKSFDDAHTYNWRLAAFRWFQGAVMGFVTGLGLGAL